jgi:hypothetical protein
MKSAAVQRFNGATYSDVISSSLYAESNRLPTLSFAQSIVMFGSGKRPGYARELTPSY